MIAASSLPPLFSLLAIMLLFVVGASLLLLKVQRSLLIAYFACGVVIANSGILQTMGIGDQQAAVNQMAEFGVMLLMFVLGMEFSVKELRFLRRFALSGGGWQMLICGIVVIGLSYALGLGWAAAAVVAAGFAMSSTAVSLKTFQDMELSGSPGARFALGVAIFQDLFIIVFLVFFPLLIHSRGDGGGFSIGRELGMLLIRGSVFLALAWVCARWGIPKLLQAVAKTRINELFTLAVIGCCVGLAWIGGLLQLSLALGAFVAGLAVSESVFKHRILADIMPVKDLFLTLFFVSVGLMVDVRLAIQFWPTILAITLLLIIGKTLVIFFIANRLGQQNRTALLAGFSLCSAGEFSLLLFQKAGEATLWSDATQQCLVTSATLSMALVPGLMKLASPISAWLDHRGWGRQHVISEEPDSGPLLSDIMKHLEDHAVICGYGPVGQAINKALIDLGIPTLIIELNVETVQSLAKGGQPVLFADAAHHETWELARLSSARFVAFTIPDAEITAEALRLVREVNPEIGILARTRFSSDSGRLERHGASVILHDESEVARSAVEEAIRMSG